MSNPPASTPSAFTPPASSASASSASRYTVTVTGYSSGGDGIARLKDGRVVFIRNAVREDVLDIMLTKVRARSAHAEIISILSPSKYRIEPDCVAFPQCGGCDFRHVSYEEELDAKLKRVNDALGRIGGASIRVSEILRTGQVDGYRNKAVFHSDGKVLGFYQTRSHKIVPIRHCKLLKDELNDALRNLTKKNQVPVGEIVVRSGRNGINPPFEEELDGLIFGISGFFQINSGAALLLFAKAREYAALSKDDSLLDLYCGVGALTIFVGRDAGYALGIEQNSAAVKAARENARRNGISHVEFIAADAGSSEINYKQPDCIIVDPPRKGLSRSVINKILELSPSRIVYVSCDPATLSRDINELKGFAIKEVCAVDMFPRTANVECICLLSKV